MVLPLSNGPKAREKILSLIRDGELKEDHELWKNPAEYMKPENFLSDSGKKNADFRPHTTVNLNVLNEFTTVKILIRI